MELERLLWEAFLAGFQASGEGHNGEYPPELDIDDLKQDFDLWRESSK